MAEETRTDECVGEFDENNVRGECQVCGGEMEHSATCEIGVLTRERDKLRAVNETALFERAREVIRAAEVRIDAEGNDA